jgi:hypothetical protein
MGEIAPGGVFAGHRIEAVAGRGGMGVVYRARQLSLDRVVALKVIAPALTEDPAIRRRFLRESRVAASLDHPHVIPVYYTGEEDGVAYIAMRYVAGDDVRTLVRRQGPLAPDRAVRIVTQVAAALDAAHAAGLVHRDVKPANVLLGQDDHVYLTDFGLTKHVVSEAGNTREGHWVGTLDFVSPEQIRGERVDARADVYALGCLLYYTLAGRPPFEREGDEAKLWAHLSEPPPRLTDAVPDARPALDDVLQRALAKDPGERYQSAGDVGRAARAALVGDPIEPSERVVAVGAAAPIEMETRTAHQAPTMVAPSGTTRTAPAPRRRALLGAGLVVALVAAAAVLLAVGGDPPQTGRGESSSTPQAGKPGPRVRTTYVGGRLNAVTAAGGRIWTGAFRHDWVDAVDPERVKPLERPRTEIGHGLEGMASSGNDVWAIASRDRRLVHFDGRTGRPIGDPVPLPSAANAVVADRRNVYVALTQSGVPGMPGDQILKIDARTGAVVDTLQVTDMVRRLVLADGALWLLATHRARIVRIDLATGKRRKLKLEAENSGDMAAGAGALWVSLVEVNQVARVEFDNPTNFATIAVGSAPAGIAVAADDVWVANKADSTLSRIDARSSRVQEEIRVPLNPYELVPYKGAVWTASLATGRVSRVTAPAE